MERLSNMEQLNKLTIPFLRRGVMTNCFLSAAEFEWHIQRGTAFYHQEADALVILFRLQNRDSLYYYIRGGGSPPPLKLVRPTVLEIALSDEHQAQAPLLWQSRGFAIALRRLRMECTDLGPTAWGNRGVQVADPGQTTEIMAMLNSGFDPLTGFLPDPDELAACIFRGEILCVEENGELQGLLQYRNDRSQSEIRHLVVKAEARGRGLADRLVNHYKERQFKGGVKRFRVWVNEDNLPARAFYEKNGYRRDGLQAVVLVAANQLQ